MTKEVTIGQFLTDKQIKQAQAIFDEVGDTSNLRNRIRDEVIAPNMEDINKKLGQENDPDYLAYAVIYVFMQASR